MQDVSLQAKTREATRKAVAALRAEGLVPGVVYGQGGDAMSISVDASELEKAYMRAGTNRLIELRVEDKKTPLNTLFVDVQHDVLSGKLSHFDLYTVKMDEEIETEIPIHFEGAAPATYNLEGVLVKNLETIEVKALPNKLPENFTVNLEELEEINASVHVSDLPIPAGVELLTDVEELIVKIDPPRSEEELEELDEAIAEDAEEQVASEHGSAEDDEIEGEVSENQSKDKTEDA